MKYSPKPDLWSKIQQRKDFDSQVKEHAQNLPDRMPKMDLWNAIESELDRKTPVIPLWKYGMVAASIGLILVLSGIAYLEFGEKEVETQMITKVNMESSKYTSSEENPIAENDPKKETVASNADKTPLQSQQKRRVPLLMEAIKVPSMPFPEIELPQSINLSLKIPDKLAQETVPQKTLHQVSISWIKIKPRMQVKTGFSHLESELGQKNQASIDQTGQLTLEINN